MEAASGCRLADENGAVDSPGRSAPGRGRGVCEAPEVEQARVLEGRPAAVELNAE